MATNRSAKPSTASIVASFAPPAVTAISTAGVEATDALRGGVLDVATVGPGAWNASAIARCRSRDRLAPIGRLNDDAETIEWPGREFLDVTIIAMREAALGPSRAGKKEIFTRLHRFVGVVDAASKDGEEMGVVSHANFACRVRYVSA
jgi:hypothetical protein